MGLAASLFYPGAWLLIYAPYFVARNLISAVARAY